MKNLIKSETYKLFRLPLYIFLLFLTAVFAYFSLGYQGSRVGEETISIEYWIANTPVNHICIAVLIFILTADFVGGDFSNCALMPSLLCGEPRRSLIFAKYVAIFRGVLPILAIYELMGALIIHGIKGWLGCSSISGLLLTFIISNFYCAVEDLVIISVAVLMTLVIKNKILLVLIETFVFFIIYIKITNIHIPFIVALFISAEVIAVTLYVSDWIFEKKDLI